MAVRKLAILLTLALATGCSHQNGSQQSQREAVKKNWMAARSNVLYGMAKQQYEYGNFAESRKALDAALALNRDSAPFYVLSAKLNIEQGQFEAAEKDLQTARRLDPRSAEADYLLGVIYQRWQRPEAALEAYAQAVQKDPSELAYLLAKAEMLVILDRLPEALELLKQKTVYFENSPAIRDAAGLLLMQSGRYAEAASLFRQATILGPDDLTMREHLAMALYYAGDYREAAAVLDRLLKNEPCRSRADLHVVLGNCHLQTGHIAEARECFQTAAQINPSMAAPWLSLARLALQTTDLARAERNVATALNLEPANSEAYLLLGYLRLEQHRAEEALSAFQKASALDQRDPLSLCMLGLCLERQGRKAEALDHYVRALRLKPDDELAATLLAQLKE